MKFFFHVEDGAAVADDLAMDLPGLAEARCEAVRYAGELICNAANHFWDSGDFHLTVTDERGLVLFTLRLSGTDSPAIRAWTESRQAYG